MQTGRDCGQQNEARACKSTSFFSSKRRFRSGSQSGMALPPVKLYILTSFKMVVCTREKGEDRESTKEAHQYVCKEEDE